MPLNLVGLQQNIPRGRTQGIDSLTRVISPAKKNANSVEKKIQVENRRFVHQLQVWPPGGATCIATLPVIAY